jgi:hypothetical protein
MEVNHKVDLEMCVWNFEQIPKERLIYVLHKGYVQFDNVTVENKNLRLLSC